MSFLGEVRVLERTFIHIQGIGAKTEKGLWKRGIMCWQDFLLFRGTVFSPERDELVRRALEDSLAHLDDAGYFAGLLPLSELWRLFGTFGRRAAYIDIETSGTYQGAGEITVIGLYDGREVMSFVNGRNLEEFQEAVSGYDLMVTFNGSSFDVPVMKRWFRGLKLPPAHLDLRHVLKRLGYRGGLKSIEKQVGIKREEAVEGLDGYDAVMLWDAYQWGDDASLERLLRYNAADIVSLKVLAELAYERLSWELASSVESTS
jgi:uncharacterized protein YprB with RNaseH-like and TPR domain